MDALFIVGLILGIVSGAFTSTVAGSKGYSSGLWFFLGLIFPGISLMAIGFCENAIIEDQIEVTQGFKGKYFKKCKRCNELMPINAEQCKYCILIQEQNSSNNIPTLTRES
jgi:hypothetical protein